jgi:chemotaxis protein MotB
VPLPKRLQTKFKDNWELSSARALNIVKLLSNFAGIEEDKFSALGYGEFRPVDTNDTAEGKAKNRRVDIYLDAYLVDKNGQ